LSASFRKRKTMYRRMGFIIERSPNVTGGTYSWCFTHVTHGDDQESFQEEYAFDMDSD